MGYIITAVIIISVLRAVLSGDPKKKAKNQRARDRAAVDSASGGRPSLDEVTRRKRQQLQELARQRGGTQASADGASGGQADPGNMTMAERIAQARAKQQHAAPAGPARQAPSQGLPSQQRQAPARGASGAPAQQQRAEALRQQLEARRLQQQQAKARRQLQIQKAKAQRPAPGNAAPPRRQAPASRQVPHGIATPEHQEVHRMVTNAEEAPAVTKRSRRQTEIADRGAGDRPAHRNAGGLNFAKLSVADLRRAFILKEVLDKPVSERDTSAGAIGG